jgi:hypothetical protein
MATTTNYGWDTPDDTDLVKDGAAAIRTLGSSVDTTTKNLNPQTTTGALAYRSATANVNTALAIGSTGDVLTVSGGVPVWAAPAPATPSFVGCLLTKTADQSISNATITKVTFDSEVFDTDGFHDNSSNNTRITIPTGKGGKYQFNFQHRWGSNNAGVRWAGLYINNVEGATQTRLPFASGNSLIYTGSFLLDLVATDYVELFAYQDCGTSINLEATGTTQLGASVKFSCTYLGA